MRISLISDETVLFDGESESVEVRTESGETEKIMDNHEPWLSKIIDSVTIIENKDKRKTFPIQEGFVYTNGTTCFVIVDARKDSLI